MSDPFAERVGRVPCISRSTPVVPITTKATVSASSSGGGGPETVKPRAWPSVSGGNEAVAQHDLNQPRWIRLAGPLATGSLVEGDASVVRLAARDPDEPVAPIARRVWPPRRDLSAERARRGQAG